MDDVMGLYKVLVLVIVKIFFVKCWGVIMVLIGFVQYFGFGFILIVVKNNVFKFVVQEMVVGLIG